MIVHFDPDDYETEDLPCILRPLHRAYLYAACRVTGHSAHALNALVVWLPVCWFFPLTWYWVLALAFYTLRELPDLIAGRGDWLDHIGDMVWVYAVGIALWCPLYVLIAWMCVVVSVQAAYWYQPAPRWMPRESLLWGDR